MCGFTGFSTADTSFDHQAVIKAMSDAIAHRGPDSEGLFSDERVSLGFRRLSIIDLENGAQPMYNEDGSLVLCFNGEIYNHGELRAELKAAGHIFRNRADSEVLLHGYEEWGEGLLNRLRGMFAFVIYDRKTGGLFAARDIFGIKPFYYYHKGGVFLFGSEIKSFLHHPQFVKELNEEMLPQYLCFEYLPNEETFFRDVFKLPAAHCLAWEGGKLTVRRYFSIEYRIDHSKTLGQWSDEIAGVFRESCKTHMIADVEAGCFLSSGVDSSYVTQEMARELPVKSFSLGYAEEKYSELRNAQELSKIIDVENFSRKITAKEFFDVTPTIQYHMDEPLPNPSAVPLYFVAQEARKQVKVVLSGEGADELFGGYRYYQECIPYQKYMKVPRFLRLLLGNIAEKLPAFHGRRFLMRGRSPLSVRYIRNNYVYNFSECKDILKKDYHAKTPDYYTKPVFDRITNEDEITQMQYADMQVWMLYDILQKADKMSMANSLELRVPFLDRRVLETALKIPSEYRVTKDGTKLALRRAALKSLPEKTADMPKIGFLTPLNDWLRQDEYYQMIRAAFNGETAGRFFQTQNITRLLDDHKAGKAHNMKKIWSVYCFIVWYEEFFVKR